MTNMWLGIPVQDLCDKHLLGLHKELHQEVGTIENHPHGEAILKGHYRLGQVDTTELQVRHDEVKRELERRDMNHDSPLSFTDRHGLLVSAFPVEVYNRIWLASTCDDCSV